MHGRRSRPPDPARALADKRQQRIDTDQEFLALGLANAASGLSQGFPVSSSGSRSVLGDAMGSRTQLYSLVAAAGVVLTMLVGRGLLAWFPKAALGAIVIYAAIWLVEVGELRRIWAFRRWEFLVAIATSVGVLVFDVLAGIGIAVGLSMIDVVRRIAHPHDGVLGYVPDVAGMHDVDDYPHARQVEGLVVYRYDAPLFFANADDFTERATRAVEHAEQPVHWLLLNTEANIDIDLTAADALTSLHTAMASLRTVLALARVKQELRADLERASIIDLVGTDRIFMTLPTAVNAYRTWFRTARGRDARG